MNRLHILVFLLIVFVGLAAVAVSNSIEEAKLRPPAGCRAFKCFVKVMPRPMHVAVITWNSKPHIVWIGNLKGGLNFPSGPSCYLFSDSGALISWSAETGDGSDLDEVISTAKQTMARTPAQVFEIINKRKIESMGAEE